MRYNPRYGFQYGVQQYGRGFVRSGTGNANLSYIGNQFTIEGIPVAVGIPAARNAWNQFDELGLINGLQRIKGEKNWEYKRRLADVFVHRANSSYRGLINGITRELGLALKQPIIINPKINPDGSFLAPDPYIKFDGVWVYLYSDYANGSLDYLIDRYQPGGNYEQLIRLADLINSTTYFEASFEPDADQYSKTMTILNQSSHFEVLSDPVSPTKSFKLSNKHIVEGTLSFSGTPSLTREVSSILNLTQEGNYYVDYLNGIVKCYSTPSIGTSARYKFIPYPFKPIASDIILHDINNDNFRIKMFNQILLDDGTFCNGVATELGTDILNELYSTVPMYWGV